MSAFIESAHHYASATFSSLRVRNYRLYYLGQVISTSGTFMQSIAQDWLVLKLSNSGVALGGVTALQYLPILLLGPYGGLVADRFSKRKIIYVTQSVAGLLALLLGVLVLTGWVRLWMVYAIALSLGMVTVFDMPARQTFVMELVGERDLKNAVTLYSTLVNLSRIIGPAVAAIIIASIGLGLCFILQRPVVRGRDHHAHLHPAGRAAPGAGRRARQRPVGRRLALHAVQPGAQHHAADDGHYWHADV